MAPANKPIEFGDYLFIEEEPRIVTLADVFKTLPANYEPLKKTHEILGKASKQNILIGARMDPEKTIVLLKKTRVKWLPRSWVE